MKKDRAKMTVDKVGVKRGVLILFIAISALLILSYSAPFILGYFFNQSIFVDGSINKYFLIMAAVSILFMGAISFFTYTYVVRRFIFGWKKNTGNSSDAPP